MADSSLMFNIFAREHVSEALDKVGDKLGESEGAFSKWAVLVGGIGVGAGALLSQGLAQAMDAQAANAKLAVQLGATGPQSAELGKVAGKLYAANYGDSLDDVNDAIKTVIQNIGDTGPASDSLNTVTAKVMDLSSAFGVDLSASTAAVGQLMKTGMAKNADEALDVITKGMQSGVDKAGDLLDTLNEYPTVVQGLGLDAKDFTGLLSQGLQGGARDADQVADALKEMYLNTSQNASGVSEALTSLGLNGAQVVAAIGQGGPAARDAFGQVTAALSEANDQGKNVSSTIATVFGGPGEDLGAALFSLNLDTAAKSLGKVKGSADEMDKTLSDTGQANLATFSRSMQMAFVEVIGGRVLPVVTGFTGLLAGGLGPAFSTIGSVLTSSVAPAVQTAFGFLAAHQQTVAIIAGIIGAVLAPALVAWGVNATVAGAANVGAWISTQVAAVGSSATSIGALYAQAAGWVTGAASAVIGAATVVGGWIAMGATALAQAAVMAAAWLISIGPIVLVVAAVAGVAYLIYRYWDEIVAATKVAWDAVVSALRVTWEAIKTAVSTSIEAVKTVISTVLGAIKTLWSLEVQGWKIIIDTVWEGIKTAVSAAIGAVKTAIAGISAAKETISKPFTEAAAWVAEKLEDIVTAAKALPGKIKTGLATIGAQVKSVGSDIIEGIKDGVTSAAAGLASTVANAAKGALDAAKHALGINSPSRVFRDEVGAAIPEGMIVGIAAGAPAVAAAVAALGAVPATVTLPATTLATGGGLTTSAAPTPVVAAAASLSPAAVGTSSSGDVAALVDRLEALLAAVGALPREIGREVLVSVRTVTA